MSADSLTSAPRLSTGPAAALAVDSAALTGRARLILASCGLGLLVTLLWSFEFVDSTIGDNVANTLLGRDAKADAIGGTGAAIAFAFVSGLAGTFTACNVAAFSAIAPLSCQRRALGDVLRPLGWLTLSACVVAGVYGGIAAAIGTGVPQLSQDMVGEMPVRLIQSSVIFGVIGLVLILMGLSSLRVIRDPLSAFYARRPRAQVVIMGALIGAFLVGRPFPLFHKMFEYAAERQSPLLGAGTFVLQSLGNLVVMGGLFLVLAYAGNGAFPRWLGARPGRLTRFTAGALLAAGMFTFAYWVFRVPSHFGVGWWPSMPWS
ncbi:MAG TPA: hypothetical protein VNO82_07955 [Solirubrobacteraceae bacterium]|nr:hypothetical protein [Solirubrobacteraceae bacterium]